MLFAFALELAHEQSPKAAIGIPIKTAHVVAHGIGAIAPEIRLPGAAPGAGEAFAGAASKPEHGLVQGFKLAQEC